MLTLSKLLVKNNRTHYENTQIKHGFKGSIYKGILVRCIGKDSFIFDINLKPVAVSEIYGISRNT